MAKCPFLSLWSEIFYLTCSMGRFHSHFSALCMYQKPAIHPGVISSLLTGGPAFETAGVFAAWS